MPWRTKELLGHGAALSRGVAERAAVARRCCGLKSAGRVLFPPGLLVGTAGGGRMFSLNSCGAELAFLHRVAPHSKDASSPFFFYFPISRAKECSKTFSNRYFLSNLI